MTTAAARASAAIEIRNAAWIRAQIEAAGAQSPRRRGMLDAHRDCIRTARYNRLVAELRTAE